MKKIQKIQDHIKKYIFNEHGYASSTKFVENKENSDDSFINVVVFDLIGERAIKIGKFIEPMYSNLLEHDLKYVMDLLSRSIDKNVTGFIETKQRAVEEKIAIKKALAKPKKKKKTFREKYGKELIDYVVSLNPNITRYRIEASWKLAPGSDILDIWVMDNDFSETYAKFMPKIKIPDDVNLANAKKIVKKEIISTTGWKI